MLKIYLIYTLNIFLVMNILDGINIDNGVLVVVPSGNVGFGTSSPSQKLHVNGNIFLQQNNWIGFNLTNGNTSIGGVSSWNQGSGTVSDNGLLIYNANGSIYSYVNGNVNNAHHYFQTVASGQGSLYTRMVIHNNGNVGIGTSSPSQKLEVDGNIKISTIANKFIIGNFDALSITQGVGTSNIIIGHGNTMNDASNGVVLLLVLGLHQQQMEFPLD
jgi:hypothetical protein